MNNVPIFVGSFELATATISAASLRTGDTNYTLLFTAGANGAKIDKIDLMTAGLNGTTSVQKAVRFYIQNGASYILIKEQLFCASATIGTTIYGFTSIAEFGGGICLAAGQKLYAGISTYTTVADKVDIVVEVKNY